MLPRPEIKRQAKARLSAQYGIAVGTLVILALLSMGVSWTFVGGLLLLPVLTVGYAGFNLRVYRGETGEINNLFDGFKNYARNLGGILWMGLFVWLWSLLFFIPGIVKAMAYFMAPYILAEYPNVKATDAIKLSMRMTQGYKGEIFVMYLSFIGWWMLSVITIHILGLFYVGPYQEISLAGMYDELKKNALAKGVVSESELL